jgi:hypothetical protein
MVNGANTTYQPAVAYQGNGQGNTPQQEPKTGRTQPIQAPVADTQHGGSRDHGDSADRGKNLNLKT